MSRGRAARTRHTWLGALVALAFGSAVIVFEEAQRRRLLEYVQHRSEIHIESVVHLVREGTKGAALAIDQIYDSAESHLATTVNLLAHLEQEGRGRDARDAEGILVWLREDSGTFNGQWVDAPERAKAALVEQLLSTEDGELVEDEAAAGLGLYCARFSLPQGRVIACRNVEELRALRRKSGLAPLLQEVSSHGVNYVAIQDASGILAGSPNAETLSSWGDDSFLVRAGSNEDGSMLFRTIDRGGTPVLEGAGPIPLPDGSNALIRVGIDARSLVAAREQIDRQHQTLIAIVVLLVALTGAGTWVVGKREREREEAERKLAAGEEERRHWQTIGQMAATVAHEVRNPLNSLTMAAQRLEREFEVAPEHQADYQELTGLLRSQTDRVNRVVTEFLDLGRPLTLKFDRLPAFDAMQEAVLPLTLKAQREKKRLELDNRCDRSVVIDRQRFGQILANLVTNALDAVDDDGLVEVVSHCDSLGLHVTVTDDGPGMDAETLQRVQTAFVTTKAQGTGLGLPLARRYAEAHGGSLTLSSESGAGSKATLFLPRPADQMSAGERT